jgi:hypothetical protein
MRAQLVIAEKRPLRFLAWAMASWWGMIGTIFAVALSFAFFPLGLLAFVLPILGIGFWYRAGRIWIEAEGDTLVIHNLAATHTISRSAIESLAVGRSRIAWQPWYRTVTVRLRDGRTFGLDVCARPHTASFPSAFLVDAMEGLRQWLSSSA